MKNNGICDNKMSFAECELAILRMQVDNAQKKMAKRVVNAPEIKKIIAIVEEFLKKKQLVCYGGISINALLPEDDKIYDEDIDLPDYDFFSSNALEDAKELADIYYKKGYTEVEAKAGQHHGTFKVYVNFLGVADITSLPKELFQTIKSKSIKINGILYTDPNFLRMGMYLELERPSGDTDRWEKVLKRLTLINKYYPLNVEHCKTIEFQQEMENKDKSDEIYNTVKNTLISQGVVFFGGYAISQYSQYMPKSLQKKVHRIPDFDVLAHDPKKTAELVQERLKDIHIKNVKIISHSAVGDIVPEHLEIRVGNDTVVFLYKPVACHSYNVIMINGKKVRIATIDTMLSFYLAFLYADRKYYNTARILCMSKFLFDVQQQNRLEQKGLLKRFSILCYGHQDSREEMRAKKAEKYKELKDKKNNKEFDEWFLNYKPGQKTITVTKSKPKAKSISSSISPSPSSSSTSSPSSSSTSSPSSSSNSRSNSGSSSKSNSGSQSRSNSGSSSKSKTKKKHKRKKSKTRRNK